MGSLRKGDLFAYLDRGIFGTFVSYVEEQSENGYVKIKYIPFNSMKRIVHPVPIKQEHIKNVLVPKTYPGVEERIVLVITNEENSIIKNIIEKENIKMIKNLQEEIKSLKKQLISAKQQASDAQSGVSKTLSKLNDMRKTTSRFGDNIDINPYPNRGIINNGFDEEI